MKQLLLNRLIIAAGQWKEFGDSQYERTFEKALAELQEATGSNRNRAVELLLNHIQGVS